MKMMQEQILMLKPREDPISESVTPPTRELVAVGNGGETEEKEGHKNQEKKVAVAAGEVEDIQRMAESKWPANEDRAAKIQRLKSGFQICKPQGTFTWPKMAIMSPQDVETVVPTPPSACSSSFVPQPPPPRPSSPIKPLAERRPVSTATLAHVTMSFSPYLSPPPLRTPPSQKPPTENPPLINLNEAPPSYDQSFGASLAPLQPRCPIAAEKEEATEKKEKEMESSSSSVSERNGWWNMATASGLP